MTRRKPIYRHDLRRRGVRVIAELVEAAEARLALGDEGIHEIYALLNPDKLAYPRSQLASSDERVGRA